MFVTFFPKICLILIAAVKYLELKQFIFPSWRMPLFYAIIWLLILDHGWSGIALGNKGIQLKNCVKLLAEFQTYLEMQFEFW